MAMGTKFVYLTALLLGIFLLVGNPASVSAESGYCSSTKVVNAKKFEGHRVHYYYVYYPIHKGYPTCIMNIGATGSAVKSVQTALYRCYRQKIAVDGYYGPKTKAAVMAMQKIIDSGLVQDGIWGPKTGSKMNWWGTDKYHRKSICVKVEKDY